MTAECCRHCSLHAYQDVPIVRLAPKYIAALDYEGPFPRDMTEIVNRQLYDHGLPLEKRVPRSKGPGQREATSGGEDVGYYSAPPSSRHFSWNDSIAERLEGLPSMLKTRDVAAVIRKSVHTVYRLIASGRLVSERATLRGSSPHLIPKASLERYLRSLQGA